jgi:CRISPR-associated endonuclease/helicase Cas3
MSFSVFFAHSLRERPEAEWEHLIPHLVGTARRAGVFGDKFDCGDLAFAAGLLHDLGKYQEDFQRRIRGENRKADHAAHGAVFSEQSYGSLGKLISHGIAGHHTGLADNLFKPEGRLDLMKPGLEAVLLAASRDGLELPPIPRLPKLVTSGDNGFQVAFLTRMLFSCLVDADYLATEDFYVKAEGRPAPQRGAKASLDDLSSAVATRLAGLSGAPGDLNSRRRSILEHALSKAGSKPGVFTLTVPTGGGKTLTSLAFALRHAIANELQRVVVAIPFTSVIEQTAQVYREAIAPHGEALLEHHSAFDLSAIDGREARSKLSLAMENWDVPLVVTTSVRLFESLFANRPSQCRKLHNLARSVIILDEVQTLPLELLRPCVAALKELATNYGCSIVLCTATQPALLADPPQGVRAFTKGFERAVELAPDPPRLFEDLRRVRVESIGSQADDEIAKRLADASQALCIVNSRAHAQALYGAIKGLEGARHLSTLMCAAHRRAVLAGIKDDLKAGRPCRVISTSLIEAGVDIDFPLVLRAEAGLDSVLQAAGRCNREGRRPLEESVTMVFRPSGQERPRSMRMAIESGESVFRAFDDVTSLEAVQAYFSYLFDRKGDDVLDSRGIIRACQDALPGLDFPFARIADDFRMIDDHNLPLIVQWDGQARRAVSDLSRLPEGLSPGQIARRLQPYTVGISGRARSDLIAAGAAVIVEEVRFGDQFVVLVNEDLYRSDVGQTWTDPSLRSSEGLIA